MKKILTYSLLLFITITLLATETTKKDYKLIHADNATVIKQASGYVSRLEGNVHFFYSDVEYHCNKAMIYEGREFAYMDGDVRAKVDTLDVVADSISYNKALNTLYMKGDIEIREYKDKKLIREFYSDRGEFNRDAEFLKVIDNVRTFSYTDSIAATCGYAEYNHGTGYGFMRINPVLTLTKQDSAKIIAEKIEFFHNFNKYVASFDVQMDYNDIKTVSNFLLYFSEEDKAILTGNPVFYSDFATAKAEEFTLYLSDKKLDKAFLNRDCSVYYASEEGEEKNNWVKSDEMELIFDGSNMKEFVARDNVSYFYDQPEEKENSKDAIQVFSEGDELSILFEGKNKVKSLKLNGRINGKYRFLN